MGMSLVNSGGSTGGAGPGVQVRNPSLLSQGKIVEQLPTKLPKISTKRPFFKKNRLRRAILSFSQGKLSLKEY